MSENRVLRKIFGSKEDEISEKFSILHVARFRRQGKQTKF
jgi:hypothetical protein